MKRTLKSKSARGVQTGDVANIMIRNLLTILSDDLGAITEEQLEETIKFFDFKCPYTGKPLPFTDMESINEEKIKELKLNFQLDHIIPQNRKECGLNIYGNMAWVDKNANSKKSGKPFEKFLRECKDVDGLKDATDEVINDRIQKIKEFQKKSGYSKFLDQMDLIKEFLEEEYNKVSVSQIKKVKELKNKIAFESLKSDISTQIYNFSISNSQNILASDPQIKYGKRNIYRVTYPGSQNNQLGFSMKEVAAEFTKYLALKGISTSEINKTFQKLIGNKSTYVSETQNLGHQISITVNGVDYHVVGDWYTEKNFKKLKSGIKNLYKEFEIHLL